MPDKLLATKDSAVCDAFAVERGVSSQALMDKAGRAVADAIRARWAPRRTVVLAGPGNNGGDGFICAKALREAGWSVEICLLGTVGDLRGDAAWASEGWDGPLTETAAALPAGTALIVDALFGAGLSRPLDGRAAALVEAAAARDCPVVAIDLPSGIRGDAASAEGKVAPADLTVTFHRPKPAHVLEPAASQCGELVVADIGIPDGWQDRVTPVARLNAPDAWLGTLPGTDSAAHKHERGRLLVFTGGAASTGAARLAAEAGLRTGAGLVTLASPPSAILVNASAVTAVMVRRFDAGEGACALLAETRASAAVLGPAMGVGPGTADTVLDALRHGAPLVLDADALTSFEGQPDRLFGALRETDILTPHPGEFARLFGGIEAVNKIERARAAAERAGCVVVLKGADTVISAPGRTPVVNRHASPHLATAGTGDTLAGIAGGLIAQGLDSWTAARAAVWIHGEAGRRLGPGLIAEDLSGQLPSVLHSLARHRRRAQALGHLLTHKS